MPDGREPPAAVRSGEGAAARLDAAALVALVAGIARELRAGGGEPPPAVHLDTDLARDLGLDSLARMELLARLERAAGASLPDRVLAEAETPRELLRAFESVGPETSASESEPRPEPARDPDPDRGREAGSGAVRGSIVSGNGSARGEGAATRVEDAGPAAAGRRPEVRGTRAAPAADPDPVVGAVSGADPGPDAIPREAATLVDALARHAAAHPERPHVRLVDEREAETVLTYGALLEGAHRIAAGLVAGRLTPGRAVAIMLPTGLDYLRCFFGVQIAGGVPLPIYPPARLAQLEDHLRRHERILENADTEWLVTFDEARQVSRLLAARASRRLRVATVRELAETGARAGASDPDLGAGPGPDDVAFLQYTSGSTGQPKGVVLTHRNVLASLDAMARALSASPRDVFVSWLPLYHDLGLIAAWLGSVVYGFPLVLMSPLTFLARPARWLRAVHRHRGTLSGGPNFAFELCTRRVADEEVEGLDLSSWRVAFNGAEPVHPDTLGAFAERFAPFGFDPNALSPVYGLAEATLGVAFTPVGRGPLVERVARSPLQRERRAEPAAAGDGTALRFVSSGVPIPGFEVRTVDDGGRETPERVEGRLQFRGPSTTSGYYRDRAATAALFDGDWLESGDLAYVAGGELFITGRVKDVVIRAGRNLHPYDFEQAAGDLAGVRRGCVALFSARARGGGAAAGTERLVAVAETRETDPARRAEVRAALGRLAEERLGQPVDETVLAPPHTVLKTSSGKIRRRAMAERYESGELSAAAGAARPLWLRIARLAAGGAGPTVRRAARRAGDLAFAGWFWSALALAGTVPALAAMAVRRPRFGYACVRAAARAVLRLTGVRLTVEGAAEPLRRGGACVIASNHASYLDGLVLAAAIPRPVRFVAKAELRDHPLARWFLDGIGVLYVDRFDTARSVAHAGGLAEALRAGDRVAIFPEGTLHRMPGLLPFRMGAFMAAVEEEAPVAPVVLRGTRSLMRDGTWFPRRAAVHVRIGEPVPPPALESIPAAESAPAAEPASAAESAPESGSAPDDGPDPAAADGAPFVGGGPSTGAGSEGGPSSGVASGAPRSLWPRAVRLRNEVRAWMLAHCGEPDLADRNPLRALAERRAAGKTKTGGPST